MSGLNAHFLFAAIFTKRCGKRSRGQMACKSRRIKSNRNEWQ